MRIICVSKKVFFYP